MMAASAEMTIVVNASTSICCTMDTPISSLEQKKKRTAPSGFKGEAKYCTRLPRLWFSNHACLPCLA